MPKRKKEENFEEQIWIFVKKILGIIFIIIGIVGLFLPILQGILLIILGLAFMGNDSIKRKALKIIKKFKIR